MKTLRTKQAKALGILGILVCVMFGYVVAIIQNDLALKLGIASAMSYFLWLGYEGITAAWIAIDGDDVLIQNGVDYTRFSLGETTKVRTFPIFRYVGILTVCFRDGRKIRTMVSDQDLTWIMSMMPVSAITPYWRTRIGKQAVPPNGT